MNCMFTLVYSLQAVRRLYIDPRPTDVQPPSTSCKVQHDSEANSCEFRKTSERRTCDSSSERFGFYRHVVGYTGLVVVRPMLSYIRYLHNYRQSMF